MVSGSTRSRLIAATRDVIRGGGLDAATSRRITTVADANLASIGYHFGSKSTLIAEALIDETRDLIAPVLDLLASDRPAAERATEAVAVLEELFDESRERVPVYLAALARSTHSPPVASGLGELWGEIRSALAADIDRQLRSRTLPDWVEPEAMAALILSLVNGVVIAAAIDPHGPDHRAVAAQFLLLLLHAGSTPTEPQRVGEP